MADISKINAVALANIEKLDAVLAANIAKVNGLVFAAAGTFLLDIYTGAAAGYSVRLLRTAYTGSCMRVREDGGNTETDIGFDSNGDLDTAAIASHCGANNGFIRYWYDQSGNAVDAGQATAGQQPQIYNGTAVITENGKPIIKNNGSNVMSLPFNDQAYKLYSVFNGENSNILLAPTYLLVAQSGNTSSPIYNGFTVNDIRKNGSNITIPATWDDAFTAYASQNLSYIDIDIASTSDLQLGFSTGGSYPMYSMQELVFYPDTSTHTITGIETNINDYFSIY